MEDFGVVRDPIWGEFFVYNTTFTAMAVGSGVTYVSNDIRIDSDADFQFLKTMYFNTNDNADIFVKYRDDSNGRYLLKNGTALRTIAGRSLSIDNSGAFDFRPFIWSVPFNMRRASTFGVEAANGHGVITPTVYIAFHGAKLRQGLAPWKKPGPKMPYVYPLARNINTLPEGVVRIAANQTISTNISIDKDSNFIIKSITGGATGAALVTIQEMGRDRQWMNSSTHIRNLVGSGAFPNVLAAPRFIPRGSVINVTIQDISAAQNDVSINFCGMKLFSRD